MTEGSGFDQKMNKQVSRRDFLKQALTGIAAGTAVGTGIYAAFGKGTEKAAERSHGIASDQQGGNVDAPQQEPVQPVMKEPGEITPPQDGMTTDVACAPVEGGGSVSQAVADANPGAWSSTMEHDVSIDRAGNANDQVMSLSDAMESNPPVQPGDTVCVAPSGGFGKKD